MQMLTDQSAIGSQTAAAISVAVNFGGSTSGSWPDSDVEYSASAGYGWVSSAESNRQRFGRPEDPDPVTGTLTRANAYWDGAQFVELSSTYRLDLTASTSYTVEVSFGDPALERTTTITIDGSPFVSEDAGGTIGTVTRSTTVTTDSTGVMTLAFGTWDSGTTPVAALASLKVVEEGSSSTTLTAPTRAEHAYKVAGADARWEDFASTSRTPASRTTWTGATTANGEAYVTSSVSDYDFPDGLVVSGSGLTIENFTAPYIYADNSNSASPNTFKFGTVGDSPGVYLASLDSNYNPSYYGQDANLKIRNGRVYNCEIFGGVDLIRLAGEPGDSLVLDYCWLHSPWKLWSSPGQGGGDSHNDIIQNNSYTSQPTWESTDLTLKRSRVDGFMTYRQSDGSTIGSQASYDHSTEVLTPGTYWDVTDPSAHSTASGFSKYDSLMTTGLYISGGVTSGDVTFDDLYLSGITYRYWSIADGFASGKSMSISNVVMWKPTHPDFANLWEGNQYTVRLHGGTYASSWSGVTDRDGASVPQGG